MYIRGIADRTFIDCGRNRKWKEASLSPEFWRRDLSGRQSLPDIKSTQAVMETKVMESDDLMFHSRPFKVQLCGECVGFRSRGMQFPNAVRVPLLIKSLQMPYLQHGIEKIYLEVCV